jgi:hypothetical protein
MRDRGAGADVNVDVDVDRNGGDRDFGRGSFGCSFR